MKCERIKELLMTDYLDGTADEAVRKSVKEHLFTCLSCRETETALTKTSASLQTASRVQPPPEIWENIQAKIMQESLTAQPQLKTRARIQEWLQRIFAPRPVFTTLTAMSIVLVALILNFGVFPKQRVTDLNGEDTTFLYYSGYQETPDTNLETDIEEYFL